MKNLISKIFGRNKKCNPPIQEIGGLDENTIMDLIERKNLVRLYFHVGWNAYFEGDIKIDSSDWRILNLRNGEKLQAPPDFFPMPCIINSAAPKYITYIPEFGILKMKDFWGSNKDDSIRSDMIIIDGENSIVTTNRDISKIEIMSEYDISRWEEAVLIFKMCYRNGRLGV